MSSADEAAMPPDVEHLLEALRDPDERVRESAVLALGDLSHPSAARVLCEVLSDESTAVQLAAWDAIAGLGAFAFEPLLEALSSPNKLAREIAAALIGLIGNPAAIGPLTPLLDDENWEVRESAQRAVERLTTVEVKGDDKHRADVESLCETLNDKATSSTARVKAIESLKEIGDPACLESLTAALEYSDYRDIGWPVRIAAVRAIATFGAAALGPLAVALKNSSDEVRPIAFLALQELGPVAIPTLLNALEDGFPDIQKRVVWALARLDPPLISAVHRSMLSVRPEIVATAMAAAREIGTPAVPSLVDALRRGGFLVRLGAADSLGKIGDRAAVGPLTEALRDEDSDVRGCAASSLALLGDPTAIGPLSRSLTDENLAVRLGVAKALGHLGPDAIGPLTKALNDEAWTVRDGVVCALSGLGQGAIAPLTKALTDENHEVFSDACRGLNKLGTSAVEVLESALKEDRPMVREGAILALGRIRPFPVDQIASGLQDEAPRVRLTAIRTLGTIWAWERRLKESGLSTSDSTMAQVARADFEKAGFSADSSNAHKHLTAALEHEDAAVRKAAAKALEASS